MAAAVKNDDLAEVHGGDDFGGDFGGGFSGGDFGGGYDGGDFGGGFSGGDFGGGYDGGDFGGGYDGGDFGGGYDGGDFGGGYDGGDFNDADVGNAGSSDAPPGDPLPDAFGNGPGDVGYDPDNALAENAAPREDAGLPDAFGNGPGDVGYDPDNALAENAAPREDAGLPDAFGNGPGDVGYDPDNALAENAASRGDTGLPDAFGNGPGDIGYDPDNARAEEGAAELAHRELSEAFQHATETPKQTLDRLETKVREGSELTREDRADLARIKSSFELRGGDAAVSVYYKDTVKDGPLSASSRSELTLSTERGVSVANTVTAETRVAEVQVTPTTTASVTVFSESRAETSTGKGYEESSRGGVTVAVEQDYKVGKVVVDAKGSNTTNPQVSVGVESRGVPLGRGERSIGGNVTVTLPTGNAFDRERAHLIEQIDRRNAIDRQLGIPRR
ncbi:MAG: hypothetical protein KF819_01860 [Labilithrix sp.]|nr:hypothetical protein [Labilithrix sp.]